MGSIPIARSIPQILDRKTLLTRHIKWMNDDPNVPPQTYNEPPVNFRGEAYAPQPPKNAFQQLIAKIGAGFLAVWKFILPALKAVPFLGKILLTSGTMLLSAWFYATIFGWSLAIWFVLGILIHEMGHVFMAWRAGIKVSAPIFIPFAGALITTSREGESAWVSAIIGIGGPLFGALAAIGYWAIFTYTGNGVFLAAAYITFLMNLFNMTPLYPLDGGRIVGAVHTWLWLAGLAIMIFFVLTGQVRNPLIFLLLFTAIPRIWAGIRHKSIDIGYAVQTTKEQRWVMGIAYVSLCFTLFWGMGRTHDLTMDLGEMQRLHQQRQAPEPTLVEPDENGQDRPVRTGA